MPAIAATPVPLTLQQRIATAGRHEGRLRGAIGADSAQIQSLQGHIDDVRQRLVGLDASLAIERRLLQRSQAQLRAARGRLQQLKVRFAADRTVLARQMVADYKADRPDLVTVILDAHGFADLLERADALRRVGRSDAEVTARVRDARTAVAGEAARLSRIESRQRQIARARFIQAQEVGQLRSALVARQLQFVDARAHKTTALASLRDRRRALEGRLSAIEARAASAAVGSFGGHGGAYGFFPAPGTNYSVGQEPELAARLDRLGGALQLHLIGISGYRTPQHSVEVGGFANDPHTRGQASDTPGVEGVPEATLERFGLTRPFPGAAEADHIQLLGG
jgi:peptidoglycan hydrolase CwlO-like protein